MASELMQHTMMSASRSSFSLRQRLSGSHCPRSMATRPPGSHALRGADAVCVCRGVSLLPHIAQGCSVCSVIFCRLTGNCGCSPSFSSVASLLATPEKHASHTWRSPPLATDPSGHLLGAPTMSSTACRMSSLRLHTNMAFRPNAEIMPRAVGVFPKPQSA